MRVMSELDPNLNCIKLVKIKKELPNNCILREILSKLI